MNEKSYKQQLLDVLYAPYIKCTQCPLGFLGRKNVVFGEGDPDAALMIIGEAPGRDEDEQARPFIGRSGRLLTKALESIGISRDEIFITNVVKCRPPENRKPLPIETSTCKKILLIQQIKIIRPKVICTLGSTSLQGLFDKEFQITKIRGIPKIYEGITVVPTYHPAYILRNAKELETFIDDLKLAKRLSHSSQNKLSE